MNDLFGNQDSLLTARNDEQREYQDRVRNYGFASKAEEYNYFREIMDLALEGVLEVSELPFVGDEYKEEVEVAIESAEGKEKKTEKKLVGEVPTAYQVLERIALETAGVTGDELVTPEQNEIANMVLDDLAHAISWLADNEQVSEAAVESIDSEDDAKLEKSLGHIQTHITESGFDDNEISEEYALEKSDTPEVALEKAAGMVMKKVMKDGKMVKKMTRKKGVRAKRLSSGEKAARKRNLKKALTPAAIKKRTKSFKKGFKAGIHKKR